MKRILMVEDNTDQRDLIREVFKGSNPDYEIDEAGTGAEAVMKVMASDFDLMLLDHRLPGKTGLDVLKEMREAGSQIPVIMMTVDTNARVTVEAMRLGISDFILKEGAFQMGLPDAVKRVLDRVDTKKDLKKARAESQFQAAKLANLGKILSEVLHEVRNPLSIISTSLESLRDAKDKEKALGRVLELMLRNVDRARQLINSLLDFSRPTEYNFQQVDLLAVVSELVGHLKLKCDRQKISLEIDSPPDLPRVRGDVQHIKGSFLNLMINAVEAMPEGGSLNIMLSAEPSGDAVRVEISDTGMGIKPEDRKHLFERYFTTKSNGTGLGLILTHEVITRHKGSIQVASAPGKGTTFTILLPVDSQP